VLLEAAKLFPDDDMIQYHLACYCVPVLTYSTTLSK
jgi:hypothetical protein